MTKENELIDTINAAMYYVNRGIFKELSFRKMTAQFQDSDIVILKQQFELHKDNCKMRISKNKFAITLTCNECMERRYDDEMRRNFTNRLRKLSSTNTIIITITDADRRSNKMNKMVEKSNSTNLKIGNDRVRRHNSSFTTLKMRNSRIKEELNLRMKKKMLNELYKEFGYDCYSEDIETLNSIEIDNLSKELLKIKEEFSSVM